MPTYTKEEKKRRKHTIDVNNRLEILDRFAPPTPKGRVIHHPRAFNKPLSCQSGKHTWSYVILMGMPYMYCTKCGAGVPEGVYHGTETKREVRTRHVAKPWREPTDKELVDKYWRIINTDVKR